MRASSYLVFALYLALSGCESLPGLEDPQITVRPELYLYEVTGDTRMQSAPNGQLQNNRDMSVDTFGQTNRKSDFGVTAGYGDGFSGFEFRYMYIDQHTTNRGTLTADWGDLPAGTEVTPKFKLNEFRLGYTAELLDYETENEIRFRFGLGLTMVHRDGRFSAEETEGTGLEEESEFSDDGLPYATARVRAFYKGASAQFDYALNPDLQFGSSDFDGALQDFEVTLAYTLEDQDLTFLAGYRWSELDSSGDEDDFHYDNEFRLEGYVLALSFVF